MINRLHIPLVLLSLAAASIAFAADTNPLPGASSSPTTVKTPSSVSNPATYTSVKGDTFASVSRKFGCSVHALKKLNGIKGPHLKIATVLEIPARKVAASADTKVKSKSTLSASAQAKADRAAALAAAIKATKISHHHHALVAQPVQDFDVAPSVFASCPTPPSNGSEPTFAASSDEGARVVAPPDSTQPQDEFPAPLVATNHRASLLPVPDVAPGVERPDSPELSTTHPDSNSFTAFHQPPGISTTAVLTPPVEPKKSFANAISDFFGGSQHGLSASESGEWGNRFLSETRDLAAQGIAYDGSWRPDGESHRWEMDCSNTTRYLYQVTAGISLPRTASDQYYYLHLQDKAWDVPMNSAGFADCNFLRSNLKPGDLLFWQNTYRPERQPPITHVMIFLGSDARGRWLMAGSQGSRGFYNRRHCGPDVYVFDPTHYVGGYTTWLGLVHHHGQFVAYGRPLEADVKKLSVATND